MTRQNAEHGGEGVTESDAPRCAECGDALVPHKNGPYWHIVHANRNRDDHRPRVTQIRVETDESLPVDVFEIRDRDSNVLARRVIPSAPTHADEGGTK